MNLEITGYLDKHEIISDKGIMSVVYLMDNMEGMKQIPDGYFNLSLDDIPYGINVGKMAFLKERNTTVKQKNGTRLNPNRNKKQHIKKEWDSKPPGQEYFDELSRVTEDQIIFGTQYTNWKGLGIGTIKWNKGFAEGVSFNKYEVAYCSKIDHEVTIDLLWAGMCQAKDLQNPMKQQGNKKLNEKRIHPCHKPVLLYDKLLIDYSEPHYKIIDPHVGGQSSRISSFKAGLPFMAFENDPDYFRDGNRRFETFISQYAMDFDVKNPDSEQLNLEL